MVYFMNTAGKLKGNTGYAILRVDTEKIGDSVRFWTDKAYQGLDIAVYTYENIPYSAVDGVIVR